MRPILMAILVATLTIASAAVTAQHEDGQALTYKGLRAAVHPDDEGILAQWDEGLRDRLDSLERAGLDEAGRAAAQKMRDLIDAERLPIENMDALLGNWRFRSIQADDLGVYAYNFFPGSVRRREDQMLVLDKTGGSQRHYGRIARVDADRLFYLGAEYYEQDAGRREYSTLEPASDPIDRTRDELAFIYKLGPEHFLVAFAPRNNRFELIEMRR